MNNALEAGGWLHIQILVFINNWTQINLNILTQLFKKSFCWYEKCGALDIAVFKGNSNSLILHISGTHGVEGYVGSEIQTDLLKNIRIQNNTCYPTIIFVHGLNPFGMKYFRRVNENNVDLNRNALFQNEHKSLTDCSTSHRKDYSIIDNIINPKYKFSYSIFQKLYRFFKMIYAIIRYGFTRCKRAMVTGTYNDNFKKGLFYGGNKLEKSHIS